MRKWWSGWASQRRRYLTKDLKELMEGAGPQERTSLAEGRARTNIPEEKCVSIRGSMTGAGEPGEGARSWDQRGRGDGQYCGACGAL